MACVTCGLVSDDLRAYALPAAHAGAEGGAGTVYLCAACRVINALNPRYVCIDHGNKPAQPRTRSVIRAARSTTTAQRPRSSAGRLNSDAAVLA